MSDSTPHSIAQHVIDAVELPHYSELAELARAYLSLVEQVQAYEDEINERTSDQALTLRKLRESQEAEARLLEQLEAAVNIIRRIGETETVSYLDEDDYTQWEDVPVDLMNEAQAFLARVSSPASAPGARKGGTDA